MLTHAGLWPTAAKLNLGKNGGQQLCLAKALTYIMLSSHSNLQEDVLILKNFLDGGWSFLGLMGEGESMRRGLAKMVVNGGRFNFKKLFCKLILSFSQFCGIP